jgi:hypothetical protein
MNYAHAENKEATVLRGKKYNYYLITKEYCFWSKVRTMVG